MHFLYILYSKASDSYYVGETADLDTRLAKHISHSYKGSFTKIAEDWELVLTFTCLSRSQAVVLERFIKRMKSRKFIQKIIDNPEILQEILSKTEI
ncbi:GIY-YIG nuclease family protein [Flavobacterium sp.]|uniref:GIY-YIG nuclease family protein n=1 Tax=Flavobacterium sp. TaxID=239 RepID=UPI002FDCCE2B